MLGGEDLLTELTRRLAADANVDSVVLFGSRARETGQPAAADAWSDIDLHLIVGRVGAFVTTENLTGLSSRPLKLRVTRVASGGVRKVTLLYEDAEADLVIISSWQMRLARLGLALGWQNRLAGLRHGLNEMSTIMRGGYRFLKGEQTWGGFYADTVNKMPGQRLGEPEVRAAADAFLVDYLWVRQKLARGELIAAQRGLHFQLAEANFRLAHELRLRHGQATFREARRLEKLLAVDELTRLQISSRLDVNELEQAADNAFVAMKNLVGNLLPEWTPPADFTDMLRRAIRW